ncbi:MAG: DUF1934 domain-containing protein [Herbinix sp.]|nr:DUF1934 domain-containing protein [Herbinix sp.]
MTKDVIISIKGIQLGAEEEPVIMTAMGTYHLTNGKHYIQYDEKIEDSDISLKNTLKISTFGVLLTKKGVQHSQMAFDLNETTRTVYQTPYGNLSLEVKTKSIQIKEASEKIEVKLKYSISDDVSKMSENELIIAIEART